MWFLPRSLLWSSHQKCSIRKAVLHKNFAIFTWETRVEVSFNWSRRSSGLQLYWKETPTQMFFCAYCKILKNNYLRTFANGCFWFVIGESQAWNFIKKETLAQVFSCEFCEISKKPFLQITYGRLLLPIILLNKACFENILFMT